MIIKRKKFSVINGIKEIPTQLSDKTYDTIDNTEDYLNKLEDSSIGQVKPVKKKTRMVRNVISGLKGIMPKKKSKESKKNL